MLGTLLTTMEGIACLLHYMMLQLLHDQLAKPLFYSCGFWFCCGFGFVMCVLLHYYCMLWCHRAHSLSGWCCFPCKSSSFRLPLVHFESINSCPMFLRYEVETMDFHVITITVSLSFWSHTTLGGFCENPFHHIMWSLCLHKPRVFT